MANIQCYLVKRASGKNAGQTLARFSTYELAKAHAASLPGGAGWYIIDCLFTA